MSDARPFVKWVGGKGRLLSQLLPLLPADFQNRNYIEPFVGGGAMFFGLRPRRALLNDINLDLVECYRAVRDMLPDLIAHLRSFQANYYELYEDEERRSEFYYNVRESYNSNGLVLAERSAAFIFLNKTCFNGLYRVNKRGNFNSPIGKYAAAPKILDEENLRACSKRLSRTDISCFNFEAGLACANERDFVYLDPPYDPISDTADFTSYTQDGFTKYDQERLRDCFAMAADRGAKLMLSNADTPFVRQLYKDWHITTIHASRSINSDASKRGAVPEVVVRNY